jgi:hypothetical protein
MLKKLAVISIVVLALGLASAVSADQVFSTPAGSTVNTESVSATADFSISGNTLTITLSNTQANMQDAGQLLTDLFFTLSAPGTPSLSTQTGLLINVGAGGTVTPTGSTTLGWGFGSATVGSLNGFELCVICQGGPTTSTTPSEGILGPPSADGNYDDGNGSIDSNGPHNPFVEQTATFTITGIPTGAVIDDAIFSFTTTPGNNVTGMSAPEPSSLLLLGTGLFGLMGFARRRFQNS